MTLPRYGAIRAAESIPAGTFVEDRDGGLWVAKDPSKMCGVARRNPEDARGWRTGDLVQYKIDGGILAVPPESATVQIGGAQYRLIAGEAEYLMLSGGKIVGIQGASDVR